MPCGQASACRDKQTFLPICGERVFLCLSGVETAIQLRARHVRRLDVGTEYASHPRLLRSCGDGLLNSLTDTEQREAA